MFHDALAEGSRKLRVPYVFDPASLGQHKEPPYQSFKDLLSPLQLSVDSKVASPSDGSRVLSSITPASGSRVLSSISPAASSGARLNSGTPVTSGILNLGKGAMSLTMTILFAVPALELAPVPRQGAVTSDMTLFRTVLAAHDARLRAFAKHVVLTAAVMAGTTSMSASHWLARLVTIDLAVSSPSTIVAGLNTRFLGTLALGMTSVTTAVTNHTCKTASVLATESPSLTASTDSPAIPAGSGRRLIGAIGVGSKAIGVTAEAVDVVSTIGTLSLSTLFGFSLAMFFGILVCNPVKSADGAVTDDADGIDALLHLGAWIGVGGHAGQLGGYTTSHIEGRCLDWPSRAIS